MVQIKEEVTMLQSLLLESWAADVLWYGMLTIFFGLPILSVIGFVIALVKYKKTPKDTEEKKKRKSVLIAFSIIAAVLVSSCIFITASFLYGIANM